MYWPLHGVGKYLGITYQQKLNSSHPILLMKGNFCDACLSMRRTMDEQAVNTYLFSIDSDPIQKVFALIGLLSCYHPNTPNNNGQGQKRTSLLEQYYHQMVGLYHSLSSRIILFCPSTSCVSYDTAVGTYGRVARQATLFTGYYVTNDHTLSA